MFDFDRPSGWVSGWLHHNAEDVHAVWFCSILFVAYVAYSAAIHKTGIKAIIKGTDPLLERVLDLCPLIRAGPQPPFWLGNRHMQFIPWMGQNEFFRGSMNFETHDFTVTDCVVKGDSEKGGLDCVQDPSMDQVITIDVFPGFDDPQFPKDAPLIMFTPGLRCHSQDLPGNTVMRAAYGKGIRSVVVNRRGHHPTKETELLSAPRFNLFGDVDDLEQVYWHVKNELAGPNTPMFLHGISSGCAVAVRALGLWDKRREENPSLPAPSFVASVMLTPGYDTSKVLQSDRFKWPYNPLMNDAVKGHFVGLNEGVLRAHNSTAVDEALAADDLQSFLDAAAPFAGYGTAQEYYNATNPVKDIDRITTPMYVLNSVDDPCCDIGNLFERSSFPHHNNDTYADIVTKSQRAIIAITNVGSHCPFLDGGWTNFLVRDPLFGGWMLNSWADHSIAEYYVAALEVYGDVRKQL